MAQPGQLSHSRWMTMVQLSAVGDLFLLVTVSRPALSCTHALNKCVLLTFSEVVNHSELEA